MTTQVLILCTHNSARSVLAEGMLNHWVAKLGASVQAQSEGSAPSGASTRSHDQATLRAALVAIGQG